jgi:hypothetical protein
MITSGLFTIAYLPPIAWFQHALQCENIFIEAHENYNKQSYRNRCKILSANGVLDLSIPIIQANSKHTIKNVVTQENEPWRKIHWLAICSAYGKSAFFLYYRDDFEAIYKQTDCTHLFELNILFIKLIFKLLKTNCELQFTHKYDEPSVHTRDFRNSFQAKNPALGSELLVQTNYYQVFAEKFPFQPNLSILDLLFNVGPISKEYLI